MSRRWRREHQARMETRELRAAELSDMLLEIRKQARVTRVNATTLRHLSSVRARAQETATIASRVLRTPLAAVNLIFADHQLTVAGIGLDPETRPLASSYCKHVVARRDVLGIASTLDEPLVCHELATTEEGLRSYLGVPLITSDGYVIGALCVADFVPREWTGSDIAELEALAESLMADEAETMESPEARRAGPSSPASGESSRTSGDVTAQAS